MAGRGRQADHARLPWVVLLLLLIWQLPLPADCAKSPRTILRDWMRTAAALPVNEVYSVDAEFLSSDPACIMAVLNGPAWATHSMYAQVTVSGPPDSTLGQETQACLANAITWRAVVPGSDEVPSELQATVGFRGRMAPTWEASVLLQPDVFYAAPPSPPPGTINNGLNIVIDIDPDSEDDPYGSGSTDDTKPARLGSGGTAMDIARCIVKFSPYGGDYPEDTNTSAIEQMTACVRAIDKGPAAPPAPPPPPKANFGGTLSFVRTLRDLLHLAPFTFPPRVVDVSWPYDWVSSAQRINMSSGDGMYQITASACTAAFKKKDFTGVRMKAASDGVTIQPQSVHSYDTCYLTATQLYIHYSGGCNIDTTQVNVTLSVMASYTDYSLCNDSWIMKMGRGLENMIFILGAPILFVILILAGPTAWRMLSWPFRHCYVRLKGSTRSGVKHQLRLKAGTHKLWACVESCVRLPGLSHLLAWRKQLLYAVVTVDVPDGHSRLLQVLIINLCTVSVSAMVWRPKTKVMLDMNPSRIALQLQDVTGPLANLGKYLQIMIISMGLGCLAYLASVSNMNTPGNPAWTIQRWVSGLSLTYLCLLVALQMINLGSYLPWMHNTIAYSWIVAVQLISVVTALTVQMFVVLPQTPRTKPSPFQQLYKAGPIAEAAEQDPSRVNSSPTPRVSPPAGQPELVPQTSHWSWTHNQVWDLQEVSLTKSSPWEAVQGSGSGSGSGSAHHQQQQDQGSATTQQSPQVQFVKPASLQVPRDGEEGRNPGEATLPSKVDPRKLRSQSQMKPSGFLPRSLTAGSRLAPQLSNCKTYPAAKQSGILVFLRRCWDWFHRWVLEETEVFHNMDTGQTMIVRVFWYPSWFTAGVLVAAEMLVFHYIKSLTWAQHVGECIITPEACKFQFVADWAVTLSLGQLSVFQASAATLTSQVRLLQTHTPDTYALVDAISEVQTGRDLDYWMGNVRSFANIITPSTWRITMWITDFGTRMVEISILGFSLGAIVGLTTLAGAMASYKKIIKKHRVLKILQRLTRALAQAKRQEQASAATPHYPAQAELSDLTRVQQAAHAGTPAAKGWASAASQANMFSRTSAAEPERFLSTMTPSKPAYSSSTMMTGSMVRPGSYNPELGGHHPLETIRSDSRVGTNSLQFTNSRAGSRDGLLTQRRIRTSTSGSGTGADAKTDVCTEAAEAVLEENQSDENKGDVVDNTTVAAVRALNAPIAPVVFFIGVLLSATIVQLYVVGVLLTGVLAIITTNFFWADLAANYYPYVLAIGIVFIINKFVLLSWIGNSYVSNGDQILRPAGWVAFMIIASITNLVIGLLLAITRLALLLLTSIFTIGMLDRSILSVRSALDLPYNSFLAGIHLQNSLTNLADPALRPGPRGRAMRRWRAAKDIILQLGAAGFEELEIRNRAAGKLGCSVYDLDHDAPGPMSRV